MAGKTWISGKQICITGHFCSVKFELQSAIKIELKSVLAQFTHWVLPYRMVESGLNGLHKLYAIIILFICRGLLGKSGKKSMPARRDQRLESIPVRRDFAVLRREEGNG